MATSEQLRLSLRESMKIAKQHSAVGKTKRPDCSPEQLQQLFNSIVAAVATAVTNTENATHFENVYQWVIRFAHCDQHEIPQTGGFARLPHGIHRLTLESFVELVNMLHAEGISCLLFDYSHVFPETTDDYYFKSRGTYKTVTTEYAIKNSVVQNMDKPRHHNKYISSVAINSITISLVPPDE